jgi:hypothetical protein
MTDAERIVILERRIANLEDRVNRLTDPQRYVMPYGPMMPTQPHDPGKCLYCGGLSCPSMTPMAVDTR